MEEQKESTSIMPGPYPPPPPPLPNKLTAYFKFAIGSLVQVLGMNFSGVIIWAAVNQTGGYMYLVDDGETEKWLAESFLQLSVPMPQFLEPAIPDNPLPLTSPEKKGAPWDKRVE